MVGITMVADRKSERLRCLRSGDNPFNGHSPDLVTSLGILPAKGPTSFFHSHIEELRMGSWLICNCRNGDSEGDRKEWTRTASALELQGTIVLVLSSTSCLMDRKCTMDQERQGVLCSRMGLPTDVLPSLQLCV